MIYQSDLSISERCISSTNDIPPETNPFLYVLECVSLSIYLWKNLSLMGMFYNFTIWVPQKGAGHECIIEGTGNSALPKFQDTFKI